MRPRCDSCGAVIVNAARADLLTYESGDGEFLEFFRLCGDTGCAARATARMIVAYQQYREEVKS